MSQGSRGVISKYSRYERQQTAGAPEFPSLPSSCQFDSTTLVTTAHMQFTCVRCAVVNITPPNAYSTTYTLVPRITATLILPLVRTGEGRGNPGRPDPGSRGCREGCDSREGSSSDRVRGISLRRVRCQDTTRQLKPQGCVPSFLPPECIP